MTLHQILTDAGVTVAIIGFIGLLIKALIDFHASRPAAGKISVETWADVTKELDRLEAKTIAQRIDIDELHKRIDALEEQLSAKDDSIKQKDSDIAHLQTQVNKLETRLAEVLIYLSGLCNELNDKGVQYTPPRKGLLDTDPRIKAVK